MSQKGIAMLCVRARACARPRVGSAGGGGRGVHCTRPQVWGVQRSARREDGAGARRVALAGGGRSRPPDA